ncbi:hypothetical protein KP509_37G033700 [Ceratopteris richardii]|uniref:Uncharacterized protein n=1 Tax=Ceratopteris richardii TaxID=49495 RepID=A0A8T2Q844_CERRI|nr:hypothetical protein KP509_37G033700 [Ceratopteris richardii]
MAVAPSHSLISLPAAAPRLAATSAHRFLLSVTCSSKRKKKGSKKPKVLSPVKPTKLDVSVDDDFLPGRGGGPSTLTALQPLVDEEDDTSNLEKRFTVHFVRQGSSSKLSLASTEQPKKDPLSYFTLASFEPSDSEIVPLGRPEDILDADIDSIYDAPLLLDDTAYESSNGDEQESCESLDEEYEWVEVDAEADDNYNGDEVRGDEHVLYWEGDLPPMTKEEESQILFRIRKDLERINHKKRNLVKKTDCLNDTDSEENGEGEEKGFDADEEDAAFQEADMALSQFEANAKKVLGTKKFVPSDSESSRQERAHDRLIGEEFESEEDESMFLKDYSEAGQGVQKPTGGEEFEDEEKQQPKRGIPAVMRSFDKAKIYVKAGNGGNGVVAFRREKYVPFGGPSGGSGGRGGHVYVRANSSLNSLLCFRKCVHFRAGRGSHGMGKSQDGAAGTDCYIDVPVGTIIREANEGTPGSQRVLLEITKPNQCELLILGGRGGRGNASFKTGRNKTPQLAENGEEGAEMWLELELKLVADVGIIGVPNAGKSTLLSVISAAQPTIGAYPFTTLLPNLGVVPIGYESTMVVADLPGLLEGAHLGIGLGHEFLRHAERCRVLVHMVDGMSQQPEQEFEAVRLELQLFNPALSEKPYIVAFNKMDIPEVAERWPNFQEFLRQKGVEPICISAATKSGVNDVVTKAYSLLQSLPLKSYEVDEEMIRQQRSAPISEFEISRDRDSKIWEVRGSGLERFIQMTNWEYFEALTRFQHVLAASGVNKALKEQGVAEGDTVVVGQMEFIWHDSDDIMATDWKRGFRGSRIWPH